MKDGGGDAGKWKWLTETDRWRDSTYMKELTEDKNREGGWGMRLLFIFFIYSFVSTCFFLFIFLLFSYFPSVCFISSLSLFCWTDVICAGILTALCPFYQIYVSTCYSCLLCVFFFFSVSFSTTCKSPKITNCCFYISVHAWVKQPDTSCKWDSFTCLAGC